MPRGIPNPKPVLDPDGNKTFVGGAPSFAPFEPDTSLPPVEEYNAYEPRHVPQPEPKLARVKLERNYVPQNAFTVIGHLRPEIKRKDPAGNLVVTQKEEFIPGEAMPATIAGTGFPNKLWAGTVIEIAEAEAKNIVKLKIGSLEFAD